MISWRIERELLAESEGKKPDPESVSEASESPEASKYLELFRKERWRLARLERMQKRGKLILAVSVHHEWATRAGDLRNTLLSWSSRLSPVLAGGDPEEPRAGCPDFRVQGFFPVNADENKTRDSPGSNSIGETADFVASQIASEEKRRTRDGSVKWVQVHRENHLLDCEILCLVAVDFELRGGVRPLQMRRSRKDQVKPEKSKDIPVIKSGPTRRGNPFLSDPARDKGNPFIKRWGDS